LVFFEDQTRANKTKRPLKSYEPCRRIIESRLVTHVRALFDQNNLLIKEQSIRVRIKRDRLWMR
jgi:hypothetical protein